MHTMLSKHIRLNILKVSMKHREEKLQESKEMELTVTGCCRVVLCISFSLHHNQMRQVFGARSSERLDNTPRVTQIKNCKSKRESACDSKACLFSGKPQEIPGEIANAVIECEQE